MYRSLFRVVLAGLAITFLSGAKQTASAASEWVSRPVSIIVSQPAGSSPDVMARMLAERIAAATGQAIIVDNKPGGGNAIGATAAARAAPDGATLYFATSAALVLNPFLLASLSYDPLRGFTPVAFIAKSNQLIVTKGDSSLKSMAELIALEKSQSGKLSIAVDGPRNLAGLIAQALNQKAKTNFVLVPYNNISAGVQDVIAGRVEAGVFSVSIVESLIRDGKLKPLSVVADTPMSVMPDLELAKSTVDGLDYAGWFMVMAPSGTPAETVVKINAAFKAAVADPKVREMSPKLGFELPTGGVGSPEQAASFLNSEYKLWKSITQQLGLDPQ